MKLLRTVRWRLFPPDEVAATRRHIREFLRRASPTYPLPRDLERRALALTRDAEHIIGLVQGEQRTADRVALDLLASTARALLQSGRYHIYRGVLSGEGHALSSAFARCMWELHQRGYQTEEAAEVAVQRLRAEIKSIG